VIWCRRAPNPGEAHQRRAAERLGAKWAELDSGHYPMLSVPTDHGGGFHGGGFGFRGGGFRGRRLGLARRRVGLGLAGRLVGLPNPDRPITKPRFPPPGFLRRWPYPRHRLLADARGGL
jgi:hypothetical protein